MLSIFSCAQLSIIKKLLPLGVPVVVQQKQIWLGTMRLWVWSLACYLEAPNASSKDVKLKQGCCCCWSYCWLQYALAPEKPGMSAKKSADSNEQRQGNRAGTLCPALTFMRLPKIFTPSSTHCSHSWHFHTHKAQCCSCSGNQWVTG